MQAISASKRASTSFTEHPRESHLADADVRSRTTCNAGQQIGMEDRATVGRAAAVLQQAPSLEGAFATSRVSAFQLIPEKPGQANRVMPGLWIAE